MTKKEVVFVCGCMCKNVGFLDYFVMKIEDVSWWCDLKNIFSGNDCLVFKVFDWIGSLMMFLLLDRIKFDLGFSLYRDSK